MKNILQLPRRNSPRELDRFRQRSIGTAQQSKSHLNPCRPLRMMTNRYHQNPGCCTLDQSPNHPDFRESRILQRGLPHTRLFVEQQPTRNRGRRAPSQRDPFSQRDRTQPSQQQFIRDPLEIRWCRGRQRELHQFKGIELANYPQGNASWRPVMRSYRQPHLARLHRSRVAADLLDRLRTQIRILKLSECEVFAESNDARRLLRGGFRGGRQ